MFNCIFPCTRLEFICTVRNVLWFWRVVLMTRGVSIRSVRIENCILFMHISNINLISSEITNLAFWITTQESEHQISYVWQLNVVNDIWVSENLCFWWCNLSTQRLRIVYLSLVRMALHVWMEQEVSPTTAPVQKDGEARIVISVCFTIFSISTKSV